MSASQPIMATKSLRCDDDGLRQVRSLDLIRAVPIAQSDLEFGACAWLRINLNRPTMSLNDDVVNDGTP